MAAKLLGITPSAVRRLVREGILEAICTRRYKFEEVIRELEVFTGKVLS